MSDIFIDLHLYGDEGVNERWELRRSDGKKFSIVESGDNWIDGRAVARQYKLNHKPDVFRVYTPEIRDSLQTLCELDLKPNPVDQ